MKKAIMFLAVCSLLLTACGQIDEAESKPETTAAAASEITVDSTDTSAKEEKDTSEAATTALITSSQTVSSSSKPTDTEVTAAKKSSTSNSGGNSVQGQNNAVQGNNQAVQNDQQQQNNTPSNNSQDNNSAEQNAQPSNEKPQNNEPSATQSTTAKASASAAPAVTNPPVTTTKPQTTTAPPESDNQVVDINAVSDQMWVFLECYPIDYNGMYEAGKQLSHDGSDISRAKAISNYAYNQGGRNCIEYALNAYFLAKGAGIECYIARSSKYDWYGHVANVVNLDGQWYYMEPQDDIVGSPTTYAAGGTASDGSVISYPDGLDIVTDIYDNQISVNISENWYGE